MGQLAATAFAPQPLDFEIVYDDGVPLESDWHYLQMNLLYDLLQQAKREQQRTGVYIGANQFVYYSVDQAREVARTVAEGREQKFRGPDVFWVAGVQRRNDRECWIAWEEDGRLPDVIFELMSKSNTLAHRQEKKELYSQVFRTAEYFVYGPPVWQLEGYRLDGSAYRPISRDAEGRMWSEQLHAFIGIWHGFHFEREADWIRLYRPDGSLVPSLQESADEQRRRADAAEAELARLRALLGRQS